MTVFYLEIPSYTFQDLQQPSLSGESCLGHLKISRRRWKRTNCVYMMFVEQERNCRPLPANAACSDGPRPLKPRELRETPAWLRLIHWLPILEQNWTQSTELLYGLALVSSLSPFSSFSLLQSRRPETC